MPKIQYPPIEYVRQCLRYEDGELYWKDRPLEHFSNEHGMNISNSQNSGKKAGTLRIKTRKNGIKVPRIVIGIDGIQYHRSVLIYGMFHGEYPIGSDKVDHKDRNTLNDKIDNLRIANSSQSVGNTTLHRDNRTGFKGVHFCKQTQRYRAAITMNGKMKTLGRFDTPEEAHEAYCKVAKEYFGEFFHDGKDPD